MQTDKEYEQSLLQRLKEIESTKSWLEMELREVRNRMSRDKNRDIIDWSGDTPKFNSIVEWVK